MSSRFRLAFSFCLIASIVPPEGSAGQLAAGEADTGETVQVPEITGLSAEEAKTAVEAIGLALKFHLGKAPLAPSGAYRVYRIEPPPSTKVPVGTRIDVTIYAGPRGGAETTGSSEGMSSAGADPRGALGVRGQTGEVAQGQAAVPDVLSQPAEAAKAAVEAAGLVVKFQIGRSPSSPDEALKVYAVEPEPGTHLARGSAVSLTIFPPANASAKALAKPPPALEPADLVAFLECLQAFRQKAMEDPVAALKERAADATVQRFQALTETLWRKVGNDGWREFFRTAVLGLVPIDAKDCLVAFYHPWADVLLVTAWTDVGGSSRLVDVEVLMGDVVRSRGKAPFHVTPGWLGTRTMPQLAVAMVAYQSLSAMEELASERAPYPAALWRKRFSGLEDEVLLAKNHTGAGLMLLGNLAFLTSFAQSEEKAALRKCVEELMAKLEAGKADEVVNSAAEMPDDKGKLLIRFLKRQGKTLRVAAVAKAGAQELVFFIDQQGGAFFVCFAFEKGDAGLRIRRIDLVHHAVFRQCVVQQTRELEGESK